MRNKIHKLSLHDVFEENFKLIALFTREEDSRMAFLLNYHLGLFLERTDSIIQHKTNATYSVFEYMEKKMFREWRLITNQTLTTQKHTLNTGLFENYDTLVEKEVYYIKELSKARFLLQIVADESATFYHDTLEKLKSISQIYTADLIDLQSIQNLDLFKF
jgi:hypothetical protein